MEMAPLLSVCVEMAQLLSVCGNDMPVECVCGNDMPVECVYGNDMPVECVWECHTCGVCVWERHTLKDGSHVKTLDSCCLPVEIVETLFTLRVWWDPYQLKLSYFLSLNLLHGPLKTFKPDP